MAVSVHAMSSGYYSTQGITASTDVRDVSDMLDFWAHEETPFLNRLSWGADSGGLGIEWISEHLGWGYFESTAAVASGGSAITALYDPVGGANLSTGARQLIEEGTILYAYSATDAEHGVLIVNCIGASDSIIFDWVTATSLAASTKFYVIGHLANEGSDPTVDISRKRSILSNNFSILRKDVNITGSQAATDMYAVGDELRHQIRARLIEMQRDREMHTLFAVTQARSTTAASMMNGVLGFLKGQSGNNIDTTTTTLTETALNNMYAECWENQGNPDLLVTSLAQTRKFTSWDRARVRTTPDTRIGGSYVARYLTDSGREIELLAIRRFPANMAFLLDTTKISLRAKKGRKLIVEKLAKTGDYEMWQILSEYTMQFKGYDKNQHGMFSALT